MEFSNLLFVYILLPVILLIYYLLPDIRKKNMAMLIISIIFYAMGQPLYMVLIVALSYLNFRLALRIDPDDRSTVILPVVMNLGVFAVFKYLDSALALIGMDDGLLLGGLKTVVNGLNRIGFSFAEPVTVLPIGVAFYTLSVISYLMDVYDGKTEAEDNFQNLLLYLLMFPKLLQGPIVRYDDVADQIYDRKHHPRIVFEGMQRFLFGLAKKVLLADACGRILAELNASGADTTLVGVWFAAVLFMFRIYYDFSGYSDMAIGLGKMFGFCYCENFNRPYLAVSVSQFWHRWHISLGSFFRDYVYIPLGGRRYGKVRKLVNMLIACSLTGLWHGAGWNYVLWGVYFFLILTVEKECMPTLECLPDGVCRCITLWLVLVGWIIFSHDNIADFQAAFLATLGYGGMAVEGLWALLFGSIPLLAICFLGCSKFPIYVKRIFDGICDMGSQRKNPSRATPLRMVHLAISLAVMCLLLWLCTVSMVSMPTLPSIFANL